MTYPRNGHGQPSVASTGRPQKSKSFNMRNIYHTHCLDKAIARILNTISDARQGGRNAALNRAAFSLGQFLSHIPRDKAEADLMAAALFCGLDRVEAKATITSGLDAGIRKPRDLSHIVRGRIGGVSWRWPARRQQAGQPQPAKPDPDPEQQSKADYARQLWRQAQPAAGTLVQTYLRGRGITCPMPDKLRFLARHNHRPTGTAWPALVALIEHQPGSGLQAIQRIYLQSDGKGKAPVTPDKMSLGAVKGGAFWIGHHDDTLTICEGPEDALSLFMAGYSMAVSCGAGNMANLTIPAGVRKIIIAADHGEAGEREAHKAAQAYLRQGHEVRIAYPPEGQDWNSLLQADGRDVAS